MADKKNQKKTTVNTDNDKGKSINPNVSDKYIDTIKKSLIDFNELSEEKRIEIYGSGKFLDQFWSYFNEKNPSLLGTLNKEDISKYIAELDKKGFSFEKIIEKSGPMSREFDSGETEIYVMEQSLKELKKTCDNKINNIPESAFSSFAKEAGFNADTFKIDNDGNLKTVEDLYAVWEKFTEKEGIELKDKQKETIEKILNPDYNPAQRLIVTVAIKKIGKALKGDLKDKFDIAFGGSINAHSDIQTLGDFATQWKNFIRENDIDEDLAKKLDKIIVTNLDIKNEISKTARKFDSSKSFGDREKNYRIMFDKIVTRQLWDEIDDTNKVIDTYIETIGDVFKDFPPYVNHIFDVYPYDESSVIKYAPDVKDSIDNLDNKISKKELDIVNEKDVKKRNLLRKEISKLKQEKEKIRWDAYVKFLESKDKKLSVIISKLVGSKFGFSVLDGAEKQYIVDFLVKDKLQDLIKNKVPDLLGVDDNKLKNFVDYLFDLNKKDLIIPSREGDIKINFEEKELLGEGLKTLVGVNELGQEIKNLPLNLKVNVTDSSVNFFEKSPIFSTIFQDFDARNGSFKVNESYKVKINKGSETAEGFLSPYPPLEGEGLEDAHAMYLYSKPINSPSQDRELVVRKNKDNQETGEPVVIKKEVEKDCDMEILEKKLNINGEAIGALLFGFVLGQQVVENKWSIKKEKEIAEKFGKLDEKLETYKDTYENNAEDKINTEKTSADGVSDKIENPDYDNFITEWERLAGYKFENSSENKGFEVGSRLTIRYGDGVLPPAQQGGDYMSLVIDKISNDKKNVTFKLYGGQSDIGSMQGFKKELPLNGGTIDFIKDVFGDNVYKLPKMGGDFYQEMEILTASGFTDLDKSFGNIKLDGNSFKFTLGDNIGKEVEGFGFYESKIGEHSELEEGKMTFYKTKINSNGTINVSAQFKDGKFSKDMDYPTFLLFIGEEQLQPKTKEQAEAIKNKSNEGSDAGTKNSAQWFSISNMMGLFKNSVTKITDGIKKYDEAKTEDLTDLLMENGDVYSKLGNIFSFTRLGQGLKTAGAEYKKDLDNRVWKKIENFQKFYESQSHFPSFFGKYLNPIIQGKVEPENRFQIAAILLATINKGKGPYRANPNLIGKGHWIKMILGGEHQTRYLAIKDKMQRELEQNTSIYGPVRADQKQDEMVKLEMKYIVDVIDGRQYIVKQDLNEEFRLAGLWSRKFASELDGAYTSYYKHNTIEENYNKLPSTMNFEFARYEFFRLIGDRPQQALANLKVMAGKANTKREWAQFEMAVSLGMLSGLFLTSTETPTKSFIQKICRTRGFLPGLWVRDSNQQTKVKRLIDMIDPNFLKEYNLNDFVSGNMGGFKKKVGDKKYEGIKGFIDFFSDKGNGGDWDCISKFLAMTGKSKGENGKTLIELASDDSLPLEDRNLLKELVGKSLEKDEDIDEQVRMNPNTLTGSVFTKSHSVVQDILSFNENGFTGKNKDDKQAIQMFWTEVGNELSKIKTQSPQNIEYFLKKFINWFGDKGFMSNHATVFIRRLKTVQDLMNKGDDVSKKAADDILWYSIVGLISKNSGRGLIPGQLKNGLEAFKDFFKNNLDSILNKDLVGKAFGYQHIEDINNPYKMADWNKFVLYTDPILSNQLLRDMPKEERQRTVNERTNWKGKNYLNLELFNLAEELDKKGYGETNRFRGYMDSSKVSKNKSVEIGDVLSPKSANIKNPEVAKKVKDVLEGKQTNEDDGDYDYDSPVYDDEYDDYEYNQAV